MVFLSGNDGGRRPILRFLPAKLTPSGSDLVAVALLLALIVLVAHGAHDMSAPLSGLNLHPVTLDPARLPEYALRTTMRMFAALGFSLLFTFIIAPLAAKSRKAELVIVPALDILQSVPILGFLTFTVTFFLGLFPGSQMGAEGAAIFAIFTSQAWNMAFSVYQSLRNIPSDLDEVSRNFGFSPWRRFIRLELPYAMPGLIWNIMMSMSGGWFFVVASEAITVGNTTVTLPGIGSWLSLAIAHSDTGAIAIGVAAMAVVILLYDQLVFRPITAWADKFRFEQTASGEVPKSWLYDVLRRTRWLGALGKPLQIAVELFGKVKLGAPVATRIKLPTQFDVLLDKIWLGVVLIGVGAALYAAWGFVSVSISFADVVSAVLQGLATLLRVVILIVLASLIWVPIGMWIGLRPKWSQRLQPLTQFLAAFPANVLFPFFAFWIARDRLDPNIWLSPLMILGTQWYILFNVIAGASAMPGDLKEAAKMNGVKGWQWWRQLGLPAIFPYYVTGALTASGGSWNASIVAEAVSWGHQHFEAYGLGSYIAEATAKGDYQRVALGVGVMSVFVILFNRTVWRPMYRFAERRLRLA